MHHCADSSLQETSRDHLQPRIPNGIEEVEGVLIHEDDVLRSRTFSYSRSGVVQSISCISSDHV